MQRKKIPVAKMLFSCFATQEMKFRKKENNKYTVSLMKTEYVQNSAAFFQFENLILNNSQKV